MGFNAGARKAREGMEREKSETKNWEGGGAFGKMSAVHCRRFLPFVAPPPSSFRSFRAPCLHAPSALSEKETTATQASMEELQVTRRTTYVNTQTK